MKVNFLTSGWPNGYTEVFIRELFQYLTSTNNFVYVASDFAGHERSEFFFKLSLQEFKRHSIIFDHAAIVDFECAPDKAAEYIHNADVVMLAGGPTLKQIEHIRKYKLEEALQNRDGITIGISAGSINMAKRVVLARDVNDDIPELSIYDGIGLVEINVEPHLNEMMPEHELEIEDAAKYAPIYGLYDESFIVEADGEITVFGQYKIFSKL